MQTESTENGILYKEEMNVSGYPNQQDRNSEEKLRK